MNKATRRFRKLISRNIFHEILFLFVGTSSTSRKRNTSCVVRRTDNKRLAKYITDNYKRTIFRGVSFPCFRLDTMFICKWNMQHAKSVCDELCQIFAGAYCDTEFMSACLLKYIYQRGCNAFYLVFIQMNTTKHFPYVTSTLTYFNTIFY